MKLWIKYLIGITLGILAAIILPMENRTVSDTLSFLTELAIRFGRYTLLPTLFFGVAISVFKLRVGNHLWSVSLWIAATLVATAVVLTLLGLLSILIIQLPRIPIPTGKVTEVPSISVKELVFSLLPFSSFQSLLDGVYLLPVFVFAGLAGAGCSVDLSDSKPTISLFDSLARVSYSVMGFFVDMLAIGMIAISCYWMVDALAVFRAGMYLPLILMLLALFLLIVCVIYPLALRFLCQGTRSIRVLYASICPILVAFFSGDANLTLPVAMRHGSESLGIKRRVNSLSYPLLAIFARSGSALVTSVCFVMILRSYSSLSISLADIMWIGMSSLVLSFLLGGLPVGGTFVALTIMCTVYGRGFEAGYLLLKPAAAIIGAFAAAIDAATMMFGSYFVAFKTKTIDHYDMKHFI
ncbi:MAG: dicarboxylate/amino acid:cation symporter [Spirochaetaceae bacterium]|nr:dicarboxylate/amino acid:cation symporter [Spirochaetaceae bacterium]MBR6565509.1 dicarboxylate/amino acid:cation symporter [Spirochaetaceae bacterium]